MTFKDDKKDVSRASPRGNEARSETLFVSKEYGVFIHTGQGADDGKRAGLTVKPFNQLPPGEAAILRGNAQSLDERSHITITTQAAANAKEGPALVVHDEMTGQRAQLAVASLDADVRKRLEQKPKPSGLRRGLLAGALSLAAIFGGAAGYHAVNAELKERHETQAFTQSLENIPLTGVRETDPGNSWAEVDNDEFGWQLIYAAPGEARFLKAVNAGDARRVRAMIEGDRAILQGAGPLAMARAAENGDGDMIKILHAAGVDVNAPAEISEERSWLPLNRAIVRGKPNTSELLLSYGADPNGLEKGDLRSPFVQAVDTCCDTNVSLRLMEDLRARGADLAKPVPGGRDAAATAMVSAGGAEKLAYILGHVDDPVALVNKPYRAYSMFYQDNVEGLTPLMNAIEMRGFDTFGKNGLSPEAELLLARGADVTAKDAGGFTALHRAAAYNQLQLVKLLISKGMDPLQKADNGVTARDVARNAFPHPVDVQDYFAALAKSRALKSVPAPRQR